MKVQHATLRNRILDVVWVISMYIVCMLLFIEPTLSSKKHLSEAT